MGIMLAAGLFTWKAGTMAETLRLEVIADTSIAAHEKEINQNLGGASRIRIKGIQHFMLMKFDLAPVQGKRIEKAVLYVRLASEENWLRTVGLSSISAPWEEGASRGEPEVGACCFQWAAYPDVPWAGPQSDFTDVTFGVGNSLVHYTDIREAEEGWLEVDVPPALIQAMICGDSYGLVLSDEKGQTMANNDVYSHEQSASRPYLMVEASAGDRVPPAAPLNVTVEPAPDRAHLHTGALKIMFTAPEGAFTYEGLLIRDNTTQEIPRYCIPHAQPGETQEILLDDVTADADYTLRFRAIDDVGNRSEWVTTTERSSRTLPWPKVRPRKPPKNPTPAELMAPVWICPSVVKINPQTFEILEEGGPDQYRRTWGGNLLRHPSRYMFEQATLVGGRGGFVSFQVGLSVPQTPTQAAISVAPFVCEAGKTLAKRDVELFRVWYVQDGDDYYSEVAVPLEGTLELPTTDNLTVRPNVAMEQQRTQALWVDLHIPKDAAVGEHRSKVEVTLGDQTYSLPLTLEVVDLTYPDELTFNLDLNGYGPVGRHFGLDNASAEYRAVEREYHRLAHKHRATLDLLGYSHSGNISPNYAPPVEGRGAATCITDWSTWDEQFGPYLSGEAFSDLPRAGVPLHNFYLWLHEDWPPPIEEYYEAPPVDNEYPLMIAQHAMRAKPIEEAFSEAHREAFRTISKQIAEHFARQGWLQTDFQCYFNNKHYYKDPQQGGRGTSWWLLDEPMYRDDWLALEYFGRLFKEGVAEIKGPHMIFREDLSRPQWQRQWLRDEIDLMVISGELYRKNRRCLQMQRESEAIIWNYGTGNPIRDSNLTAWEWVVRAYLAGADAIVPWNTIGGDEHFEKADPTAILYPGKRFGINGPLASLRLKVWRDAAQDVELLILLGKQRGWNREQLAAWLASARGLTSDPERLSLEPWKAAEGVTVEELERVREGLLYELAP
ncbi:MAG: hypothetical protein ACUVX8_14095 [Candidatus Zipacnadales bacterium]